MKKNKIFKSIIFILLGVILLSLTGCSSKVKIETEGDNDNQTQTNVVSKNYESNNEQNNDTEEENTKQESSQIEKTNENEISENIDVGNDESNSSEEKNIENKNSEVSKEEIVKKAFLNYIAETAKEQHYKLSDYRIDNVQIVSINEIRKISPDIKQYYPGVKSGDIFATVTYSVKPADSMDETFWIAGNGEIDGQWIKNKMANIWLVENNGEYTIESNGTGW